MMYLAMVYLILFITSFVGLQVSLVSADHAQTQVYIVLTTSKPTATSQIEHNLAILDSLNTLNDVHDGEYSTINHHYIQVLPGFSARMSIQQFEYLRQLEDVIEVYPDTTYNLYTTHSPQFLGLNNPINFGHHTSTLQDKLYELSQDVIIGVLDTEVWPESQSFYDHKMSTIPSRWKGGCDNATDCNKKLIGARGFINGSSSARDFDGHGTHTASTAAGALVRDNGEKYTGVSLYSGQGMGEKPVELVYGTTSNNSKLCFPNSLNSSTVKGKVVICDRGITPRMAKGMVVKTVGGVGMILVNAEENGRELAADSHVLPAVALTYKDGAVIKTFANTNVSVMLTFGGTVMNVRQAPRVTGFSSRGPFKAIPGILKPDLIGPGLNVLAAWSEANSPSSIDGDNRTTKFNIISGTSMSCPHISGLAALLKAAHPDWNPSVIKSALMTTAYTLDNTNSSILDMADNSIATPWALGAGHVDIVRAVSPGLVYNATSVDFIAFLCSYRKNNIKVVRAISGTKTNCTKQLNDPGQLNYPSFSVVFNKSAGNILTYSRELTNVEDVQSTYNVSFEAPQIVEVAVNPSTLVFHKIGDTQQYNVTFTLKDNASAGNQDTMSFGSITWMNGKNRVRSPIVISMQSNY